MGQRWGLRLAALAAPIAIAGGLMLHAGAEAAGAPSPTRVADVHGRPFSSVGRLDIEHGGDGESCTATLVGDNRTIITASHCVQPGAGRLTFHLGDQGPGVEATIVARGEAPLPTDERAFDDAMPDDGEDVEPSPYWDDWLLLDLAQPVAGEPMPVASAADLARLQRGEFAVAPFHVAGFPMNVDAGHTMVWAEGTGIPAFPARGWRGARAVVTRARTYDGMSGGAVLLPLDGADVVVGLVSGGDGDETVIMVGGGAFPAVEVKRRADCRRPAGLSFASPCGSA